MKTHLFRFRLCAFVAVLLAAISLGMPARDRISVNAYAQSSEVAEAETKLETLRFQTASGAVTFSVEVMRTDAELTRGLMFRRFLPADRGMLLAFKVEQPVMMWMKNTYLPLDMVFISRSGIVVNIVENTEPLSERIIPSGAPTYAVLEINAGIAKKNGLKVGDRAEHSLFN